MVGSICVKHKRTGAITSVPFARLTDAFLAKLKANQEIVLYCGCTREPETIELKVGIRESGHYLYNAHQGQTEKHDPLCHKHARYMGKPEYEPGFLQEENGEWTATLAASVFMTEEQQQKKQASLKTSSQPYEPGAFSYSSTTTTQGELTLLGLLTKVNLMTWERLATSGQMPQTLSEFLRRVYGTMKTIYLATRKGTTRVSLQSLVYAYRKIGQMRPRTSFQFVYMQFVQVRENPFKSGRVLVDCQDTFGHAQSFDCAQATFGEAYDRVRFEHKERLPLFVGGFVYKASRATSHLTFSALCLFVTTHLGLYCESSYELEAYERLCVAHRRFYKPYKPLPAYDSLVPDLLFVDTDPPVIGEIFGFGPSHEDYLLQRARKCQVAEALHDQYGFWKWDAFACEPFPALPPPSRAQGGVVSRDAPPDPSPGFDVSSLLEELQAAYDESAVASASGDEPEEESRCEAARLEGKRAAERAHRQEQWREQARQKVAPKAEQQAELEEEFFRALEEAGYVKVSVSSNDEKKKPL